MIRKSNKQVTVELTYSWTFNEKDWINGKEHSKLMQEHPSIVFGYDPISCWHNLNDVTHPKLKNSSVKRV